jgi:hypothetical protein
VELHHDGKEIELNEFLISLADDEQQYLEDAINYILFRINYLGQKEVIGDFEALNIVCNSNDISMCIL